MSKDMMKQMRMVIDLEDDTVLVEGKKIDLETMESGIYIKVRKKAKQNLEVDAVESLVKERRRQEDQVKKPTTEILRAGTPLKRDF